MPRLHRIYIIKKPDSFINNKNGTYISILCKCLYKAVGIQWSYNTQHVWIPRIYVNCTINRFTANAHKHFCTENWLDRKQNYHYIY